jgi:GTP-binding protein
MVDISVGVEEAAKAYHLLENELKRCSQALYAQPRWVLLNKCDVLLPEQVEIFAKDWRDQAVFAGPMFAISGVARTGLQPLLQAIMQEVEAHAARVLEDDGFADQSRQKQAQVATEVRLNTQKSRGANRVASLEAMPVLNDVDLLVDDVDEFEGGDDFEDGIEVIYTRE